MSFFTTLVYYRPTLPPPVTADHLAHFVASLAEAHALNEVDDREIQLKFGDAIDQDSEPTFRAVEIAPRMFVTEQIEWDIVVRDRGRLTELVSDLLNDARRIYRASMSLGKPVDEVLRLITRVDSPENEIDYRPDTFSMEIGPIEVFNLQAEVSAHVGWIEIGFSGYGYLYPWTLQDAVARLHNSPQVRRLMELCREFWPVSPTPLAAEVVEWREQYSDLWPYEDAGKPLDWYWGLQEGG